MAEETELEPWLRGTLTELDAVPRQVVHALILAEEDVHRWCGPLSDVELNATPFGLPAVAFQVRHMARSLDRLLSYAEGRQLSEEQMAQLWAEGAGGATRGELFAEFDGAIAGAVERVRSADPGSYGAVRHVGRRMLPTTLAGLLIHCAEHTQRHVGQAITTAKVLRAVRAAG